MPRKPRLDPPESWHHVVNRGIAKRVMFERREDIRYFLSRLALQVRAGRIEVHAYSIMQTHYHLLLRSPGGFLSEAMRRIQNSYVRRFNRIRRRDGSLARGRFYSRMVDSDEYLHALVRYIDGNAVRAGLAAEPSGYEFGSARHYLSRLRPPWLRVDWVLGQARALTGGTLDDVSAYCRAYDAGKAEQAAALVEVVESRMASMQREGEPDPLFQAALGGDHSWMSWKARLADGISLGVPVCGIGTLRRVLSANTHQSGVWMVEDNRRTWKGVEIAFVGWARRLCGHSEQQIALLLECSKDRIRYLNQVHLRLMRTDENYASRAMEVGRAAVTAAWSRPELKECGTPAAE
ncbi:MAG: transposase [Planctomycetota bacterium]|nr:transposase [Planctomycetota bacterium]